MYKNYSILLKNKKNISTFITDRTINIFKSNKEKYFWLNLWLHVSDKDINVIENRIFLAKQIWKSLENFVFMNQIHSWNVVVVWEKDKWKWVKTFENWIKTDAMITNISWIVLIVLVADCIPVLFYDKIKKVVWVAHAGWKWTAENIVWNVIKKMKKQYDSNPSDILVCLWPSISKESFEVWAWVAKLFNSKFSKLKNDWKYLLDLQRVNKKQLIDLWILEQNIEISSTNTFENENYFSARKLWYDSGRFWAWIYIK